MTNTALSRLLPEVRTLARPTSGSLLAARSLVQRNADLQAAFIEAKAQGWSGDQLAEQVRPLLLDNLEGTPEEVQEAALYLADEYLQMEEGILLVSSQTGKMLARITEEDIWQPPPVKREDGTKVAPLPRIRPDLEGFLVEWVFDRSREQEIVSGLAPLYAGSAKAITHEGRKGIVERIRANADQLLAGVRGGAAEFLAAFDADGSGLYTVEQPPSWGTPLPRTIAFAKTRMSLTDFKALNLRFDVLTNQQSVLGTVWVAEMARTLGLAHPEVREVSEMTPDLMDEATFWAGSQQVLDVCRRHDWPCLALDGNLAIGLRGIVGTLEVHPDTYRVSSREVLDTWEVGASVEYTLWVDWSKVTVLRFPPDAPTVTVL